MVLLDGHMPEMDGFEVTARIKQNPRLRSAAVILLTSVGSREDLRRVKNLGAAAALTKPIKQSELWDAMVTALLAPGDRAKRPSAARIFSRWPAQAGCAFW